MEHDLVVVFSVRLSDIAVRLNDIVESLTEDVLEESLELLQIGDSGELRETNPSADVQQPLVPGWHVEDPPPRECRDEIDR